MGPTTRLLHGDAATVLAGLPEQSVACCVTSPPYWSLRDYLTTGQIGAEGTVDEYVANLVRAFSEVWRVLRDDGVMWLVLGDCYTSGNRTWRASDRKNPNRAMATRPQTPSGLKPKELVGLPWRVAFALQQAGWYLRAECPWEKPNCQPESVRDRPTRSHETVFLITKGEHYHYDAAEAREPSVCKHGSGQTVRKRNAHQPNGRSGVGTGVPWEPRATRNLRSVWRIPTKPLRGLKHVAVFPAALAERCIRISSRPGDVVCDPFCGSGTVGMVSRRLGRSFIGIDLNADYLALAQQRIDSGV